MTPSAPEASPATPPVKLLLVDDEPANLLALEAILDDLGHPIVTARSGAETFRRLLQDEFALILLDVSMPDLNGLELAALLQQQEEMYLTPIIFITAHYTDAESAARSYHAGGVDYLIKPVNPDILRAKVRVFVQLAQVRQQLKCENAQRRQAEASLRQLNTQLEQRVAQRTTEFARANQALCEAKEELGRANTNLELLVQERTARLEEMVRELELFSYSLTHDMRAPLRSMRSFSELLLEGCRECAGSEIRDYLQRIVNSARRMDLLITDALRYSKVVKQQLALAPVDAKALLQSMLESYPDFAPSKADIQVVGDIPLVLANEAGLTQCFSNLLGNAVKFVVPGQRPQVRIRAELVTSERSSINHPQSANNSFVRLWFEDNGIGIPKSAQARIFDMFQQATHGYGGTGIGLALVRKVTERMSGTVGVESEPGQGSRFWMELQPAVN